LISYKSIVLTIFKTNALDEYKEYVRLGCFERRNIDIIPHAMNDIQIGVRVNVFINYYDSLSNTQYLQVFVRRTVKYFMLVIYFKFFTLRQLKYTFRC